MTTNDISTEKLHSLSKDGISEDLFKLLWAKDELNSGPSINIPDTIIYKYGTPVSWYFTSTNGKIKKKLKHNLVSAKIEETFNKHVLGYDVLAVFISMPAEAEVTHREANVIEYLDREALNNFLYNRKKEVNGILQRFIEPKSTRNELVRAIWSPKVCLLERSENIHQLHDHRYGLYERCVIYEGPEYYTTSAPLRGPVLSGQLQKLCEEVVAHISEVTFGQKQVSRIVLNFKVDSRDKIWLMYSTSIRCLDMLDYTNPTDAAATLQRQLLNIDSVVSLSNTVHLNPAKTYEKIVPKKRIRCLSCARDTLEDMRHAVTYKAIIKHYEHILHLLADGSSSGKEVPKNDRMISWPPDAQIIEAAGGVGFGCLYITDVGEVMNPTQVMHYTKQRHVRDLKIPPVLHNIHYKLSIKSFERCKNDPLFLYKTVQVCEPCYLVYAEFTTMLLRMGQDLTKLLTPDPAAAPLLDRTSSSHLDRPSSADWRAISTTKAPTAGLSKSLTADGGFRPSANHRHALDSAIGIRSSDHRTQPDLPRMVRDPLAAGSLTGSIVLNSMYGEGIGQYSHSQMDQGGGLYQNSLSTTGTGAKGSPVRGGLALEQSFSSGYDANEVRAAIADRERHFFKEVALNPHLKDQHPLMHLISAQQKLKLIDEQSGVLASKTANKSESIFGTRYGKQSADKFMKNGAYAAEIPYAINGEIILPSKLRQRKQEELRMSKSKKSQSLKMLLNPGSLNIGDPAGTGGDMSVHDAASAKSGKSFDTSVISDPNVKSSQIHRNFLLESLKRIEDSAAASESYAGHYTGALDDRATVAAAVSPSGKGKHRSPSVRSPKPTASSRKAMSAAPAAHAPPPPPSASKKIEVAEKVEAEDGLPAQSLLEGSTESELMQKWGLNGEFQGSGSLAEGSLERNLVSEQADLLLEPVHALSSSEA